VIVAGLAEGGVALPAIGEDDTAGHYGSGDETCQRAGRDVVHDCEADAATPWCQVDAELAALADPAARPPTQS
jgi:hypothetical protein